jgi:hypothetical protein
MFASLISYFYGNRPGRLRWYLFAEFLDFLASTPTAAVIVFVIVIGGLLIYLGYTLYKIFFKYK